MKNDLLCRAFIAVRGSLGLRQEATFAVRDDKPVGLNGVQMVCDDERVVCDAGIARAATVAQRLGVNALAQPPCGCVAQPKPSCGPPGGTSA
jgi:hypothetical protein